MKAATSAESMEKLTPRQAEAALVNYSLLLFLHNQFAESSSVISQLRSRFPSSVYPALIEAAIQARKGGVEEALKQLEVRRRGFIGVTSLLSSFSFLYLFPLRSSCLAFSLFSFILLFFLPSLASSLPSVPTILSSFETLVPFVFLDTFFSTSFSPH